MRVVLIDDHEIFRLGLRSLLEGESDIEIVGEADSGEAGLSIVAETCPDVVLLDYSMPGVSGLEILVTLRHRYPNVRVILLTATKAESVLTEALASDAHAVVLKQDASSQLVRAVLSAFKGDRLVSSSIESLIGRSELLSELTKRERQVMRLIAHGYRNREIGEELNISLKTVDTHRTNLMRKLDLHNLVDLVELANRSGVLDSTI